MKAHSFVPALGALLMAASLGTMHSQVEGAQAFDNVVVVLDASGSMRGKMPGIGGTKMDAAKMALKRVLQNVPASTQVGLLVFSARGVDDPWVYPLGPRRDSALAEAIDRPVAHGSTPLGQYLKIAADRLLQERIRQLGYGTFRLLVVTDGEAQDQDLVERYTPEILSRGIVVDVIGVAMDQQHTLATRAHSYRSANDADALQKALTEIFAEVGGGGSDQFDEEAFATLASIPASFGSVVLPALANSGNQPIGERPGSDSEASSPPTAGPAASPGSSAVPNPPRPSGSRSWKPIWIGLVLLLVLRALIRGGKRRRRHG